MNEECQEYYKGVFLLNQLQFSCGKCGNKTLVVSETAHILNKNVEFCEVRVEFNYDPFALKYRGLAIIHDDSPELPKDANVLTVCSPLIKTDKRALRMAESYLAQMLLTPAIDSEIPHIRETILDFDNPIEKIKKDLEELHYRLFYAKLQVLKKNDVFGGSKVDPLFTKQKSGGS